VTVITHVRNIFDGPESRALARLLYQQARLREKDRGEMRHGAQTLVVLAAAKNFDQQPDEGSTSFILCAPDMRELYEDLREKGVEVSEPVSKS
jgi:hypothetical protein